MAQNEEFYNFEEALDQLRLKEEELKRLVSEGEIRAFREGDTMRLRRTDVEHLKDELMGGEVVDLAEPDEELVFEDDVDLEDPGMATEEIADMDTLLDEDVEDVGVGELDLDEEEEPAAEPAVGAAAMAPAVAAPAPAPGATSRRGATAGRRGASVSAAQVEEASEGMLVRFVLLVTTAVLLLGLPVAISLSAGSTNAIARMIAKVFGQEIEAP